MGDPSGPDDETGLTVEVRQNEKGAWCVLLDGQVVSRHRTYEAARLAAQSHLR
jgi:hypothetical protein